MKRRFAAVITAVILLWTVCFPAPTVYAMDIKEELPAEQSEPAERENNAHVDMTEDLVEHIDTEGDDETGGVPLATGSEAEEGDISGLPETMPQPEAEPGGILAPENESDETPIPADDGEEQLVNRIFFDGDLEPYFIHIGESIETLALHTTAFASYGFSFVAECEIVWRYDELDTDTPGRKVIVGDILLPEGCVFEEEPLTVRSVVIVYDDSGAPFIQLSDIRYMWEPVVLPQDAAAEEVARILNTVTTSMNNKALLCTEYGDSFSAPLHLDTSVIDTAVPGAYYPLRLDLPGGITFDEKEPLVNAIYVVPTDEVVLDAVSWSDFGHIVRWLYPAQNPQMWISVDDEDWWTKETNEEQGHPYGMFFDSSAFPQSPIELSGFYLVPGRFEEGHSYRFQVQYDGDRFSDVLVLDFTESVVPQLFTEPGGDRNGGDREENRPPSLGSPPPESEKPPTSTEPTPDEKEPEKPSLGGNVTPPATDEGEKEPEKPSSGGGAATPPARDKDKNPPTGEGTTSPVAKDEDDAPPMTDESAEIPSTKDEDKNPAATGEGGMSTSLKGEDMYPSTNDEDTMISFAGNGETDIPIMVDDTEPVHTADDTEKLTVLPVQPPLAPNTDSGEMDSPQESAPYSDSWVPTIITALIGFGAAAAFLLWRKKGGKRYGA